MSEKNPQSIVILHNPDGTENPYVSKPEEKHPRKPVQGETVFLKALTFPRGRVHHLAVELWDESENEREVLPASRMSAEETEDRWVAALPEVGGGKQYRYRFIANPASSRVFSEEFSFEVYQKVPVQRLLAVEHEESLVLWYQTAHPDLHPRLELFAREDGGLGCEWTFSSSPPEKLRRSEQTTADSYQLPGYQLQISQESGLLTLIPLGQDLKLEEAALPVLICDREGEVQHFRQTFFSPDREAFYGFGERYNTLDQRGNLLDTIVYNQWQNQGKRTYFPVPYFLSSRDYSFFLENNGNTLFDLCSSMEDRWSYQVEMDGREAFGFILWPDPDPAERIRRFTDQVGKPVLPPTWAFGLWMSSNCWNSQQRVQEEVQKSLRHEIPASVVVLEAWSDETTIFQWYDAEYPLRDPGEHLRCEDYHFPADGRWPDPKGMVEELNELGMELVLWQVPVIKSLHEEHMHYGPQPQHKANWEYLIEKQYCLFHESGEPYRIPDQNWFARSLMPDFTHPDAARWWMEKRRYLVEDIGVAGFKTDGGEQAVLSSLVSHSGIQGAALRNLYPIDYLETFANFLKATRGNDWVLFSRAGFTGAQRFSCHWAGDQDSTWDTIRECLYAGLSAGMAGVSFWGWDIGGFSDELPTAELYLRSAAVAAFCPLMQFHSIISLDLTQEEKAQLSFDRSPWNVQECSGNPEVVPAFRRLVNVRMNLFPYLLSEAAQSAETGIPLMRSAAVFTPDDLVARQYPFQYYLGGDLLVAPVVEEGAAEWRVWLPEGMWIDFWTREEVPGGQEISRPVPLEEIPVYIRKGAILPLNLADSLEIGDPVGQAHRGYQRLCFQIYPQQEGILNFHHREKTYHFSYHSLEAEGKLHLAMDVFSEPVHLLLPCSGVNYLEEGNGRRLAELDPGGLFSGEETGWCWDQERSLLIIRVFPDGNPGEFLIHGYCP